MPRTSNVPGGGGRQKEILVRQVRQTSRSAWAATVRGGGRLVSEARAGRRAVRGQRATHVFLFGAEDSPRRWSPSALPMAARWSRRLQPRPSARSAARQFAEPYLHGQVLDAAGDGE